MTAHVRLSHLTKRFGSGPPAVEDVSLEVPRGSFTTLLGPSGCGKTTTLRMIAGFYEPDAGDILLGDRRINDVPAHRRSTAMVFQDYALFPHMSVLQNVAYGLKLARMPRDQAAKRVAETIRFLGLAGLENRSPNELSGGQQQRVALARALVMNPEVLLLDEPLSNLDAKLRVSIRGELISIQRQLGLTTIYVTHDQEEALAMSDWVAVMNHGRVVQWGTPWEVYYQPRTPFMADFVGSVNLIRAATVSISEGRVRVRLAGREVDLPLHDGAPTAGADVLLSIRPETLRLAPNAQDTTDSAIPLAGMVTGRAFLGHLMRYTVRVDQQDWIVEQPDPAASPPLDGSVTVLVNAERIHVITETD
ncbi:MAG: ABC transporter ATP-binding protein [Chloroflexi bacterium]|nr:ABC transporter ATP-binding protein [Chloroflexota bacterium]